MIQTKRDISNDYNLLGYYIIEDFISRHDMDTLKNQAQNLIEHNINRNINGLFSSQRQTQHDDDYFMTSGDKICFFHESDGPQNTLPLDHNLNKIGHALHDRDQIFKNFSYQEKIFQLLSQLGYSIPKIVCSQYIFKQPKIGSAIDFHQDGTFVYTEPESTITLWFALDDSSITNGCLYVIPGAHKNGLKRKFIYQNKKSSYHELSSFCWHKSHAVPLPVKAGSLVIMHGNLPHMSEKNNSVKARHAYIMNIIESKYTYPKTNWILKPKSSQMTKAN